MKFLLRFLLPLAIVIIALAIGAIPLIESLTTTWFVRDLDLRSRLILNSLEQNVGPLLLDNSNESRRRIGEALRRATQDERLLALAVCSPTNRIEYKTELFPTDVSCNSLKDLTPLRGVIRSSTTGEIHMAYGIIEFEHEENSPKSMATQSVTPSKNQYWKLILLHDMSFASRRSSDSKLYLTIVFFIVGLVIAFITILIARWSMATWIRSVRQLVGGVRANGIESITRMEHREFLPILKDLKGLVRDLDASAREKDEAQITWDAKKLKEILNDELSGEEVIVVSNRQPYIHNRQGNKIEIQSPASGLVTAVEPILKACSGIWIAHGNGSADREVVDYRDRVRVPPQKPMYDIHRVWLSKEEEDGYYYGFSNEGLWPLCHIAHTRPIFRVKDWDAYVAVNQKFTDAIVHDSKSEDPVVLVQDYHFALVPRMLREKLPRATIITFWHIPWPNPESFGICPWREELLDGLLGSSIIGFHTQFHCNNFIDAVDRFLESRIDRETNAISYHSKITEIRPYPISIEWPPERLADVPPAEDCRKSLLTQLNLSDDIKIGIGVDRLDYTKGIVERLRAVERLFELEPKWIGKFIFIQIAAPSRSSIPAYQQFELEVRSLVNEINGRFGKDGYQPIILRAQHHEPIEVFKYFRAADISIVSSLHDGMNLVAKEFVASREDKKGVLLLSMFAGASRELAEALIINPYDADQTAMAIISALSMSLQEQKERMNAMRAITKEYNVFRWAGRMLLDAARVRRRNRFANKMDRLTRVPLTHIESRSK